jgi:hypothetical protein
VEQSKPLGSISRKLGGEDAKYNANGMGRGRGERKKGREEEGERGRRGERKKEREREREREGTDKNSCFHKYFSELFFLGN